MSTIEVKRLGDDMVLLEPDFTPECTPPTSRGVSPRSKTFDSVTQKKKVEKIRINPVKKHSHKDVINRKQVVFRHSINNLSAIQQSLQNPLTPREAPRKKQSDQNLYFNNKTIRVLRGNE